MAVHPLAGKPAPVEILIDVAALENAYYERQPNIDDPQQLVSFGTSGHRGSPLDGTLNETHILGAATGRGRTAPNYRNLSDCVP